MRRLFIVWTVLIALAGTGMTPVRAASGLAFLPQTAGQRITYHLVRTMQTVSGPQVTTSAVSIVRRAGTTLVIERPAPDGTPNLSVLKANSDGSLALADKPTASDGDLTDLLYAFNAAIAIARNGDPAASGTWLAVVPTTATPNAATAQVVLAPSSIVKTAFDFSGNGQGAPAPAPAPRSRDTADTNGAGDGGMRGGGPFPGGGGSGAFPGGGGGGNGAFPGGGYRRRRSDDSAPASGDRNAVAVAIHVEGHASNGSATRIGITETRTIVVAGTPYNNVGNWTITAGP